MPFQKGNKLARSRQGKPNKTTMAAKEAFQLAFHKMGGWQKLAEWGADNEAEFYKIYGRLIPVDTQHSGGMTLGWPLPKTPLDK